jgi:hypothetical protein
MVVLEFGHLDHFLHFDFPSFGLSSVRSAYKVQVLQKNEFDLILRVFTARGFCKALVLLCCDNLSIGFVRIWL